MATGDIQFCYLRHRITGHPCGVLAFKLLEVLGEPRCIEVSSSLCRQRSFFSEVSKMDGVRVIKTGMDPKGDIFDARIGRTKAATRLVAGKGHRVVLTESDVAIAVNVPKHRLFEARRLMEDKIFSVLHPSRSVDFDTRTITNFMHALSRLLWPKRDQLLGSDTIDGQSIK